MEPTTKNKLHKCIDYYVHIDPKRYATTVEPLANHIHCDTTGKSWGYRDTLKKDAPVWPK